MLKRHQLTKEEILPTLEATKNIPVRLISVDIEEALKIAIEFNIYAYDAYFLQCAKATLFPLCTLDRRMRSVAEELRIPLIGVQL